MSAHRSHQQVGSTTVLAAVVLVATLCLSGVSCFPDKRIKDCRKVLHHQKHELIINKLKCEPKATFVHVKSVLEFHDLLADEEFFPKVVSVKRCLESCSFCGIPAVGDPVGRCQPVQEGIVDRSILTFYFKDNNTRFQQVVVKEHTACTCSS